MRMSEWLMHEWKPGPCGDHACVRVRPGLRLLLDDTRLSLYKHHVSLCLQKCEFNPKHKKKACVAASVCVHFKLILRVCTHKFPAGGELV